MPAWVARLPHQVGYPAGGSLGADEWKGIAMVYCPIVVSSVICLSGLLSNFLQIPLVWDEWYDVRVQDHLKKVENWDKKEAARFKRLDKLKEAHSQPPKPAPRHSKPTPKPPPNPMHHQDADAFLKLCTALKIIMARTIIISQLPRARSLLQDYLWLFVEVSINLFVCSIVVHG